MEDKLVTVAIHTYEKAQMLKKLLENEGIEAFIHNVNTDETSFSAGVRVRIKESDLTKALSIIVNTIKAEEDINSERIIENTHKILIPVDFSDYSMRACDVAFKLAYSMKAEVTIFHTYYTPAFGNIPILDSANDDEMLRIEKKVKADLDNLKNGLKRKMNNGDLPSIRYKTILKEGIPEEEITKYSLDYNPSLIIMGTRTEARKEQDLIGSVTAEVIERSNIPVLAIPENILLSDIEEIKNIAFVTNFNGNDLIAFERMMSLLHKFPFKIFFVHIDNDSNKWDEIKLVGIKEYFKKQYPALETEICLLKGRDIIDCLDGFIVKNKIDLVSTNKRKRNMISRLFNPSVTRKLIFHAKTPMLIYNV